MRSSFRLSASVIWMALGFCMSAAGCGGDVDAESSASSDAAGAEDVPSSGETDSEPAPEDDVVEPEAGEPSVSPGECTPELLAKCGEGEVCEAGECICAEGTELCDTDCVDTATSLEHCGGCGESCPAGTGCEAGECVCEVGTLCGDTCVDTDNDSIHCGECNNLCPQGATCSVGECICVGLTLPGVCGNVCTELSDDVANCGECGVQCASGAQCVDGACQCPEGLVACGTLCVDLQADSANCGECGVSCPTGASCIAGVCDSPPPRLIAPLSGSNVTTGSPEFRWESVGGAVEAQVEVCEDADCEVVVASFFGGVESGTPPAPLPPGLFFWRARSATGGQAAEAASDPWLIQVGSASSAKTLTWGCISDMNRDGIADAVVGACGLSGAGCANEIHIFSGGDGFAEEPPQIVPKPAANQVFGYAVSVAGDVNGDGFIDLVVGDWASYSAYVFHGSLEGIVGGPAASLKGASGIFPLFGHSVAAAGDVNGDGYADVVIGDPIDSAMYLYFGSPEGISEDNQQSLYSLTEGAGLGLSVGGACDVNGDGYADVIGGTPTAQEVYVFLSSPDGVLTDAPQVLSGTAAQYGISVACAGDVNSDGYADVLVGGYQLNGAFLYYGSEVGLDVDNFTELKGGANHGVSVAAAGDLNADGFSDAIVGGSSYASIYLGGAEGLSGLAQDVLSVPGDDLSFGNAVGGGGDLDADGYLDALIGAPEVFKVFVFRGEADGVDDDTPIEIQGPEKSGFGYALGL